MRVTAWLCLVLCSAFAAYANPETTFELPNGATMDFVWIEPGTFLMGSPLTDPNRNDWEEPQHQVSLTAGFWLGKYEVTQGQWEAVMGTTPWVGRQQAESDPQRPAAHISWNDVQAMAQCLNEAVGEQVYRLPTSAEWEYACRAGTTTAWHFGDNEVFLFRYEWYRWNACEIAAGCYPRPVGTLLPNPWGLYDMHGNVAEWVEDSRVEYTADGRADTTDRRVLRGGMFGTSPRWTRSAMRLSREPCFADNWVGARLVRDVSSEGTGIGAEGWGSVKRRLR